MKYEHLCTEDMVMKSAASLVATVVCLALPYALTAVSPAFALSSKECSAKYKAAKEAGTLGGKGWNDFRKAECGAVDKPTEKSAAKSDKPPIPKVTGGGGVIFPTSVAAEFAGQTPYKQRLRTCAKQFQANKATGANGKLRWIQKGGGYWSQCNARLKKP